MRDGLTKRAGVRMRRVWCAGVNLTAGTDEATSSTDELSALMPSSRGSTATLRVQVWAGGYDVGAIKCSHSFP